MNPKDISIDKYDYPLPDERIAKHPLTVRDSCKLLVRDSDGTLSSHIFSELPSLLPADAMLIYNNTRVINARLRFRKESGATIEIFCLEPAAPTDYALNFASTEQCSWTCFVGNSKRWKTGALDGAVNIDGKLIRLTAERVQKTDASSVVKFSWDNSDFTFAQIIKAAGEIPIPPYLNRKTEDSDTVDYQTVYSHIDGSVAAPTAGLHFTPEVLNAISERNIPRLEVTLHVGAGTFQPVKSDTIGDHAMHSEFIAVDTATIDAIAKTDRKIYAVGTTSVRTLESLYHIGCLIKQGQWNGEVPQWYPYEPCHPNLTMQEAFTVLSDYLHNAGLSALIASTRIIIAPGYTYRVVKGMVTNFHQPKSTLLLLVSALMGDSWHDMYDYALANDYRFLSYGDACLLKA